MLHSIYIIIHFMVKRFLNAATRVLMRYILRTAVQVLRAYYLCRFTGKHVRAEFFSTPFSVQFDFYLSSFRFLEIPFKYRVRTNIILYLPIKIAIWILTQILLI